MTDEEQEMMEQEQRRVRDPALHPYKIGITDGCYWCGQPESAHPIRRTDEALAFQSTRRLLHDAIRFEEFPEPSPDATREERLRFAYLCEWCGHDRLAERYLGEPMEADPLAVQAAESAKREDATARQVPATRMTRKAPERQA